MKVLLVLLGLVIGHSEPPHPLPSQGQALTLSLRERGLYGMERKLLASSVADRM